MIKKMELSRPEAIEYVRKKLSYGGFVCERILQLPLSSGAVYALALEEASEKSLYAFESGGIYSLNYDPDNRPSAVPIQNESRPAIVEEIRRHIATDGGFCIIEEPLYSLSEVINFEQDYSFVYLDDKLLYYFVDRDNFEEEMIDLLISDADGYYFLCALGTVSSDHRKGFLHTNQISPELLEEFTKTVASFFVNAYDFEGYLMWVREG